MFNFFKRKYKPTIKSIEIPNMNWELVIDNKDLQQWVNDQDTIALSLYFFDIIPDIPTINNLDLLRNYYRQLLIKATGAIIEVEIIEINGFKTIKSIFKLRQEQDIYLGSYTIPFENCSFVVKIQAPNFETIGMRETIIADKLIREKSITLLDDGTIENWFKDPYEPNFKAELLMNKAELQIYDEIFPTHALSELRTLMKLIEKEIKIDPELKELSKFNQ